MDSGSGLLLTRHSLCCSRWICLLSLLTIFITTVHATPSLRAVRSLAGKVEDGFNNVVIQTLKTSKPEEDDLDVIEVNDRREHNILSARANATNACKLPANQSVYLSEGFGYDLDCAPSTGSLNTYMFFVDFPDEPANDTVQDLYDVFLPDAANWYHNSSFGKLHLNVTADTSRFYRMPRNADSYGWQRGLTSEMHLAYIQDAVDAYFAENTTAGLDFDFADNHVLYIVPTANATSISFSPTYMDAVTARVPGNNNETIQLAKKVVTFGHDAYVTWHYKTLNHETGHTMCLPDLYPLDGRRTGLWVGGWDIQGYINGPSPDYFAWHKWKLGWLNDEQIGCISETNSSTHVLSPMEVQSQDEATKALVVKRNDTFVLVAEVRSTLGVDEDACGTGVLLYTVSTVTDTGVGPIKVIDTNPGSGGCGGDELNDAPLTLGEGGGNSTWTDAEWGVSVTVLGREGEGYVVRVDTV